MPSAPPRRSRLAAATAISSRSARSRISAVSRQPCSSTVIGIQFRVVSSRESIVSASIAAPILATKVRIASLVTPARTDSGARRQSWWPMNERGRAV